MGNSSPSFHCGRASRQRRQTPATVIVVNHSGAFQAWARIKKALQASDVPENRELAKHIVRFVSESAYFKEVAPRLQREAARQEAALQDRQRTTPVKSREVVKTRPSVAMER
jgi:hypothetical protein